MTRLLAEAVESWQESEERGRDVRARVNGILQLPLCRIHRTVARNATLDFAFC